MFNRKRRDGDSGNQTANGNGFDESKRMHAKETKDRRPGIAIAVIIFIYFGRRLFVGAGFENRVEALEDSPHELVRRERIVDIPLAVPRAPPAVARAPVVQDLVHHGDRVGDRADDLPHAEAVRAPGQDQQRPGVPRAAPLDPIPAGMEHSTYSEIRHHFDCRSHAQDQTKELHTIETWQRFRTTYIRLLDGARAPPGAAGGSVPPDRGYAMADGRPPPYAAGRSPGKGRGLFATRDIPKGELVHDGDRSKVTFKDGTAWRRFVFALPREMACDIAEWSWTQTLTEGGPLRVNVDLNIAAFMNSGWSTDTNVGPKTQEGVKLYAERDIGKGDEILYDYGIYETSWRKVGLG